MQVWSKSQKKGTEKSSGRLERADKTSKKRAEKLETLSLQGKMALVPSSEKLQKRQSNLC